nr:MAG TPA: hypothetical protein [Caudoviricetes sp.]
MVRNGLGCILRWRRFRSLPQASTSGIRVFRSIICESILRNWIRRWP